MEVVFGRRSGSKKKEEEEKEKRERSKAQLLPRAKEKNVENDGIVFLWK